MSRSDARCGLIDTNVLVYADVPESEFHQRARALRDLALAGDISCVVAQQNLVEYAAILSDSRRVAKAVPLKAIARTLAAYEQSAGIKIITPNDGTLGYFMELLNSGKALGQHIFDTYLVATMLSNGVDLIYTADHGFKKFKSIKVVNPFESHA